MNNKFKKGTGKKKKPTARVRVYSKENAGSIEDEKIEEYLKVRISLYFQ